MQFDLAAKTESARPPRGVWQRTATDAEFVACLSRPFCVPLSVDQSLLERFTESKYVQGNGTSRLLARPAHGHGRPHVVEDRQTLTILRNPGSTALTLTQRPCCRDHRHRTQVRVPLRQVLLQAAVHERTSEARRVTHRLRLPQLGGLHSLLELPLHDLQHHPDGQQRVGLG